MIQQSNVSYSNGPAPPGVTSVHEMTPVQMSVQGGNNEDSASTLVAPMMDGDLVKTSLSSESLKAEVQSFLVE